MNHRLVNTVINRCKMPSDGDILVPIHTVAVIGTTDERASDPELLTIEPWEVSLMLEEGDKLVPGLSRARVLRAWAGVRPLYQEGFQGESRDATRALTLLDHRQRDGVAGLLTITGGKWTTFRLMAETTMDAACAQLGVERPCRTADTPVPGVEQGHYWLGHRLDEVEAEGLQGELICECEFVTRAMIEGAVRRNPTLTLDDLRRDVRLGMGPCQGGFCTYRAAGILHELNERRTQHTEHKAEASFPAIGEEPLSRAPWDVAYLQSPAHSQHPRGSIAHSPHPPIPQSPNLLLRDFLQERWKGLVPILWGEQLKQERLDELIYLSVLNADHLPEQGETSPLTDFFHYDGGSAQPTDPALSEADRSSTLADGADRHA
jgi:glycerol-3-phosphate dehydrogenase